MPAFVEMHPRVPMRRGVTATDVPAGQGTMQVHPPRAYSQAILAAFRTRRYIANHFQMRVNHLVPIPSSPMPGWIGAAIGRALSYVDAPFDKDFYERWCNTVGCGHVGMDGPAQAILAVLFGDKCPKALMRAQSVPPY
jgi:hypothetical protein